MKHAQCLLGGIFLVTLVAFSPIYLVAQNTPSFSIEDRTAQFGEILDLPVTVSDFQMIVSTQFTISWDTMNLRYAGIDDIALGLSLDANFGTMDVAKGYVTYFFEDVTLNGTNLPDEASLFTISLEAIAQPEPGEVVVTDVNFTNSPTLLEVADTSFSAIPADFIGGEITILGPNSSWEPASQKTFNVVAVQPNPFVEQVLVQFDLPKAGKVEWTVSDTQGKVLQRQQQYFGEGLNQLSISADQLPAVGAYLLSLQYDQQVLSKRLVYLGQ